MRFVDLFCGIGGFHSGLQRLGHECIFASDIDHSAAQTYELNWGKPGGFEVHSDIRKVIDEVPAMDIICAGFPCQPFSKSGSQKGFHDKTRGTLFHDICYLTEKHRPSVLFLENVPNLVSHDSGNTFKVIEESLIHLGYDFNWSILSPHNYEVPQIRTRVYIVAIRKDLVKNRQFLFPEGKENANLDVKTILDKKVSKDYDMTEKEIYWLQMWEDFLKNVNIDTKLPGHPIWANCFKGEETLPGELELYSRKELIKIHEQWTSYGWVKPIKDKRIKKEIIKSLNLPLWKQDFIKKNRYLYSQNKSFIDGWLERWGVLDRNSEGKLKIPVSRTKYEWQAGPDSRTNWENIFQFRPSGIRVKRGNYFPALVAMAQIPVIGWLKRRLTPKECARIQSFDVDGEYGKKFVLGNSDSQAYKQLGNAVNVNMIYNIQGQIDKFLLEPGKFPEKEKIQTKLF